MAVHIAPCVALAQLLFQPLLSVAFARGSPVHVLTAQASYTRQQQQTKTGVSLSGLIILPMLHMASSFTYIDLHGVGRQQTHRVLESLHCIVDSLQLLSPCNYDTYTLTCAACVAVHLPGPCDTAGLDAAS